MADLESKIKQSEATINSMKASMADPKDIEKAKKQLRTYQKQLDEMKSGIEQRSFKCKTFSCAFLVI